MTTPPTDRAQQRSPHEAAELAGAPIELVLIDAARGGWRRFLPDSTLLHWARGLAGRPRAVGGRIAGLGSELGRIVTGASTVAPEPKDRRFADPAWAENPLLKRTLQTYLATSRAAKALVDDAELTEPERLRVETLVTNVSDAVAPSNAPLLNPRALKALVETGGKNYARGARRLARDLASPPRVPSMVEPDAFTVGETVAASPGAVVAREEVFELLQYSPSTEQVRDIPLVIVPPTINKFYAVDMSPGRSLVEYLVGQGHQVFVMSWRNPDVRHARWGFDAYGRAIIDAIDTARAITGAPKAALLAMCSGGVLSSMVLAHLAAIGEQGKVAGAALSVAVLDQQDAGLASALVTPGAADAAVRTSAARGYLDGRTLAEVFAWLRPNDLVWSYWVESYLLGQAPRPLDVLFWNADTTRMTAALHREFINLAQVNGLAHAGAASMLGTPLDLSTVDVDTYITAGVTDHLCPWRNCYRSTQLLGGKSRFILSTSGHIASIVNPPGGKSSFRTAERNPEDVDDWLATAEKVDGSWWPDFSGWLHARTGELRAAPAELGGPEHPMLERAPGSYVLSR